MKPIIDGVISGALGGFISGYAGGYGQPIADLAIGYFRNNQTLKTIGSRSLGAMLSAQFTGGNGGGVNGSVYS